MQLTCNMGTFVIMEEPHPHITMATASLSLIDSKNVQKFHRPPSFFKFISNVKMTNESRAVPNLFELCFARKNSSSYRRTAATYAFSFSIL